MSMPNGVLQGIHKCPEGHEHEVCITGSVIELAMVTKILGLTAQNEPTPEDLTIILTSESGSYCTMRPVSQAVELIAIAVRDMNPPF